jgi:pterin-4a-carbinolamine dehydratase
VDAAVFLFAEDDKVWYRESEQLQPRDNVLLEYGVFASHLGLQRSVVCRVNRARAASDLAGVTTLNLKKGHELDARTRLRNWIREIKKDLPVRQTRQSNSFPSISRQLPLKCDHVARRLLPEEIAKELEILPDWIVVDGLTDDTPPRSKRELCKRFVFKDFADAIAFMANAVEQINIWDHHPRWENTWNQTIVNLTTWSIGHEISPLDIQVAHFLEDLYTTKFSQSA